MSSVCGQEMALTSHRRAPALPPHMLDAGAMAMQSEEKVPGMLPLGGGGEFSRWARALRSLSSRGRLSNETWVRGGGSRQIASHFTPKQGVRRLLGSLLPRHRYHNEVTKTKRKKTKFPHHHARKFFHCAKLRQPPTPAEQHKIISNPLLPRVDFPKAMLPDADASGMDCHPSFYEASTPKKTILPTCQSPGFQHQLRQRPALFQKSLTSSSIAGALVAFGMVSVQQRSSSRRWFAREVRCKNLKAENISRLALKQAKFSARLWFSI